MRTRATLVHTQPVAGTTTSSHLVLTLVGEETDAQRPKVGIVPVLDTSGSMGAGDKLAVCVRALTHLTSYLGSEDDVALVAFSSQARTALTARHADTAGARAMSAALAGLRAAGGTALHAGLIRGLAEATAMDADALVRVIVLTDGHANVGPTDEGTLTGLLVDRPEHVSVSFLGVGTDCDHALLGRLARAGGGSYGFIEAADRAADVLGTEIGGLLHTEVHRLKVRIVPRSKYLTLTGGPLGHDAVLDGDGVRLDLGNLLVGATKHVVVPVQLAGSKKRQVRPVTVADVHVAGISDDEPLAVDLRPKVQFVDPGSPGAGRGATALLEVVELAQVGAAIRAADEHARQGHYAAATGTVGALHLNTARARTLAASLADSYAPQNYLGNPAAPIAISSTAHALTGSLAGSSVSFDAFASRTLGGYVTDGQREVAVETSAAVSHGTAADRQATSADVRDLLRKTAPPLSGPGGATVADTDPPQPTFPTPYGSGLDCPLLSTVNSSTGSGVPSLTLTGVAADGSRWTATSGADPISDDGDQDLEDATAGEQS